MKINIKTREYPTVAFTALNVGDFFAVAGTRLDNLNSDSVFMKTRGSHKEMNSVRMSGVPVSVGALTSVHPLFIDKMDFTL